MMLNGKGVSYVVTVAIMTSITVVLGLFLWGIVGGWAGVSAMDIVREVNKGIAQQRSLLVIELVDLESKIIWVSNPGKVDLVVLSCIIYPRGSNPPPRAYQGLAVIDASMENVYPLKVGSECQLVGSPPYIIEITAIALPLYNDKNPTENIQWAIVVRQNA